MDKDCNEENENPRIKLLENEIHDLKEQLQNYIPRRRVRRVFKDLKKILEQDLPVDDGKYLNILKGLMKQIEVNGTAEAGVEIKEALEYILSRYEIQEELESDLAYDAVLYSEAAEQIKPKKEVPIPENVQDDENTMVNQYGVPIKIQRGDSNEQK